MKRPAVFICCFYLMGLLIGYYVKDYLMVFGIFSTTIIISIILYKTYSWKIILLFPLICFFAYLNIYSATNNTNIELDKAFEDSIASSVEGYVSDITFLDDSKVQFVIKSTKITFNSKIYTDTVNIKVYGTDIDDLSIGDPVRIKGTLSKLTTPKNQGQFDEEKYYRIKGIRYKLFLKDSKIMRKKDVFSEDTSLGDGVEKRKVGITYYIKNMLYKLRVKASQIYDNILPSDKANLMKAMILGEKSYLSIDTKERYSQSGISHVLAISGLHISILGYGLFQSICSILSRKKSVIITVTFLVFYCLFTGASVSTVRATMMLTIILMAYLFGRTYDIFSSVGVVALILLVVNPFYLWDVGFLLSFSAVLGIIMLTPILNEMYNKNDNQIIGIFNASLAATLGTAPIMIFNYYEVHIYSVFVNMLVVPLMSIIVLFGFIGLLLGSVSLLLGKIFSGIVFYILNFYDLCCESAMYLPFHTITIGKPMLFNIVFFVILLILIVQLGNKKRNKCLVKRSIGVIFCGLILINLTFFIIPGNLKIVHLDIGQGDSTVIISPHREVYIVDGGGNRKENKTTRDTGYHILRPFLKYNGINKIDCLIMTHSDGDHIGGLIELIDYFIVDKVIIPSIYKNKEDVLLGQLINKAASKGIPIVYINKGDVINDRDITFETLYPSTELREFHNNNAHSLVLKLKYKLFNVLLTGDIEKQEEQYINKKFADSIESDIIKVPHHGSSTSSTEEFVNNVKAKIAIISCGKKNRYGHPHKEVVERYLNNRTIILNTSVDGAITIKTDGYNMGVSTYYSKKQKFIKCK